MFEDDFLEAQYEDRYTDDLQDFSDHEAWEDMRADMEDDRDFDEQDFDGDDGWED